MVDPEPGAVDNPHFGRFGHPQVTPQVTYDSKRPSQAITDMVQRLMGVVDHDPRQPQLQQQLSAHFDEASALAGVSATEALRSTFTLACSSPSFTQLGL